MSESAPQSKAQQQLVDVAGMGRVLLPRQFAVFTGPVASAELRDARDPPAQLLQRLAEDVAVALTGPYAHADAAFRYCQRFQRRLVPNRQFEHIADRTQRSAAFTQERRRKLHRLLLPARGDRLLDVDDPPDTAGLQQWLEEPTGDQPFLIPLRRLQRILTDMRRAAEGIDIDGLDQPITILPHVYVPADLSVPAMLGEHRRLIKGKHVLDMGTGTGVLALLAARLGAAGVVATDSNPGAVANAQLNAERLGLAGTVHVRGPADLFDSVPGETFDVILFNAPWIQSEPQSLYDRAICDPGYRVIDGFLKGVGAHLSAGGVVLLQYSDVSQRTGDRALAHLEGSIGACGLRIVDRRCIRRTSRVLDADERVFLFEIRRDAAATPTR